jgi:hypothetical protein
MRSAIAGCVAGLAALALASAASAGTITFDGSCDVTGVARFTHPLSGQPAANGYIFDSTASGTACSGTVNGKQVTAAPAVVHVEGNGTLSCAFSEAQAGVGTLTMTQGTADPSDDVSVGFKLDVVGVLTEVPLRVSGTQGGFGVGEASFRSSAGTDTPSQCAGAGIPQLGFTASFRTIQPIVSEASAPAASGGSSSPQSSNQPSGGSGSQPSSSGETASSAPSSSAPQPAASSSTPTAKAKHKKKHRKHKKHKHKKHKKKKRHH